MQKIKTTINHKRQTKLAIRQYFAHVIHYQCTHVIHRATTSFGYCSSTASLPVQPHCANAGRIRCQADLNSFPLGELEETTWTSPYFMEKTTQQDLESLNLSPKEASDVAQNRPLWRMMSTFGATHSWWCMPEMNK